MYFSHILLKSSPTKCVIFDRFFVWKFNKRCLKAPICAAEIERILVPSISDELTIVALKHTQKKIER